MHKDEPDLVRLEKSLVLLQIISETILVGSTRESGLSQIYASILYCSYWWKMKMQDIARINGATKSTATHYIDYLEKKGFVRRVRDEGDRRDVYVELTEKGREWVQTNTNKMMQYLQERQSGFTPEEWSTLIRLISRLAGMTDEVSYDELLQKAIKMKFI